MAALLATWNTLTLHICYVRVVTISFSVMRAQPDESMVYEGLVQYIVERHIILTAELMVSS